MEKEKIKKFAFSDLLELFPEIELPVTLTPDSHHVFGRQNDPIPEMMALQFFEQDSAEKDPFTEYMACFRIRETHDFHALVFWKAGLLNYEYYLVTYSKKGEQIDKKMIAHTKTEGDALTQSVVTIEEDWSLQLVQGTGNASRPFYEPTSSKIFQMELLADGRIILL